MNWLGERCSQEPHYHRTSQDSNSKQKSTNNNPFIFNSCLFFPIPIRIPSPQSSSSHSSISESCSSPSSSYYFSHLFAESGVGAQRSKPSESSVNSFSPEDLHPTFCYAPPVKLDENEPADEFPSSQSVLVWKLILQALHYTA